MSKVHRCPVCEGRGNMPAGFFDRMGALSSLTPDVCRACKGTGLIVMGDDPPAQWDKAPTRPDLEPEPAE